MFQNCGIQLTIKLLSKMATGSGKYESYNRGVRLGYITAARRRRGRVRGGTDRAAQLSVGF